MSKLLKSKFLIGVMAVAVMFVGVVALNTETADAASCSTFTMTLRKGMKNDQVKCLQETLNEKGFTVANTGAGSMGSETTYFGSLTKAAVMSFQSATNLVVDGIFGPMSRAALTSTSGSTSMTYPDGCTSTEGFSTTTGQPCNSGTTTTTLPAGCMPGYLFSSTTGQPCTSTTTTTTTTGPVTATLASDNPASGTLVAGQATADLAHFAFSGSGTVTGVTLQRLGVSADSTPSNVYLFNGATRLTDAASVSSDGKVTFTDPSGLFTVDGSMTLAVRSDIASSTSGQTVGFMLATFTTSDGTVTVNLSGNIHTIATATLASVSAGTVTPSGATINPGAGVTLWQSTLTVSTRDVEMTRLSLRNIGSAPAGSFGNFKLYVNGVEVGTASSVDANGYVTFDLSGSPVTLASGSRILRMDADVLSGASRTVQFSLRNAADVDFVDSSFGVNISPTSTPWTPSSASTISGSSGGTLTIVKDTSSPSTNLVNGGSDAVLGIFRVTAFGEPIKIETLRVAYTGSANIDDDDDSLRNARVLIDGVQYGSTASLNETTDSVLAYTSYTVNYTVNPGTPVLLEVRSDVFDNGGANDIVAGTDTIQAVIATGSTNAQRLDSLGSFNAPSSAVSANTLTVGSTALTLAKDTTYTNQTVVLPQTAYKIGDWNLTGSSVEDVLLSTFSFDLDEVSGTTLNENDVTNLYVVVKDASGAVTATPLATVSAVDNNFSLNYTLAKNGSVMIELYGDLASGATATDSFKTDLTVTGTAITSGTAVTATSADTNGQTIIAGSGSLTVTQDASTPVSTKFADNQTVRSAAFKFAAVNSGYKVTDITLTIPSAGATVVQTVNISSTTENFSASRAGGATVTFSGLDWDIPANQNAVLNVDLVLGTVSGTNGGTSGASLLTTLTSATAVSAATGTSAAATESNPAGNVHYAYAAVPSITMQTLPSTVLTNGTKTLAKFTVNTDGTGTVAWKEVLLDITKTGGGTDSAGTEPTITSPTLWDADTNTQITAAVSIQNANGTSASTCAESDTTCEILITVGAKSDDNVEKQISGSKTYEVRATIGGTLATGDYVFASIDRNLSYAANAVFTSVDNDTTSNDASFVWSDVSAASHDTGTADWTNEALLNGLPTTTWTMTK